MAEPNFLGALRDPEFRAQVKQGLKDAANRGVASFFGGPVDLASMVMRPFGYSTPDREVVGGSEWIGKQMEQRGMVSEARNPIAEFLSAVALPAGMARAAPGIFRAEQQAIQNAMAPRTLDPQTGAIVWHGTPHKFDKFDSSKIGTGEGAQAYGHGLYLAESPDVAKEYADKLGDMMFHYDGKPLKADSIEDLAAQYLFGQSGDKLAAIEDAAGNKALQNAIRKMDYSKVQRGGSIYKIDLPDEQIAKMLDWDKPLSQQAPEVQMWLNDPYNAYKSKLTAKDFGGNEPTGGLIVNRLQELMSEGKRSDAFSNTANFGSANASRELKDYGIPGIRYLDGGSRGTGQGTSNFVVFPGGEEYLQILERNGQPLIR